MKKLICAVAAFGLVAGVSATASALDLAGAFKEAKVSGNIRTYYFERDFDGDKTDKEDLAVGGVLNFQTAPLQGISAGIGFKTSQGASWNDDDKDVYGLLAKDDNKDHANYSALNQYYLQYENFNTTVKLGAQYINTPWLNKHDNRLTPNSYRALSIVNKSIPNVELQGYYVADMMKKTSEEFVSMSESVKSSITEDKSVLVGGLVWKAPGNLKIQLWEYYGKDLYNNAYLRADYSYKLNEKCTLSAALQYLNQEDTGDALAGERDTYMLGGNVGLKAYGAKLNLYYAQVGDDTVIFPWGHNKVIVQQINGSQRAEEDSFGVKLAYNLKQIGLKGLSAYVYYAHYDTPDSGDNASPNIDETDFNVQYKFGGSLKGLSLRARHAIIDVDEDVSGVDFTDTRLYLQYKF